MRYVRNTSKDARDFARFQRKTMTGPERFLRCLTRKKRIGFRVRTQFPVDNYVLDFYIVKSRLAIEVDGPMHEDRIEADRARDEVLRAYGIEVLRFSTDELIRNEDKVLDEVRLIADLRKRTKPWAQDRFLELSDEPGFEVEVPPP